MRKLIATTVYAAVVLAGHASADDFDYGEAAFERHMSIATRGLPAKMASSITAVCGRVQTDTSVDAAATSNADVAPVPTDPAASRVPAMQVFDNLYFVGDKDVSVWAVTTAAGIILLDAHHAALVEDRVIGGLRQLGLDPSRIKYVVITHGHDDHYGGAKLLQERYGARVAMGEADWKTKIGADSRGAQEPLPRRDIVVRGRQTIELGGTTITLIPTPGHTPGTLSALIPVTDRGERHVAVLVGGGHPFGSLPAMKDFATSVDRLGQAAALAGVDILISNHPKNDQSIDKMQRLGQRQPGDSNPFVIGADAVSGQIAMAQHCARGWIARNGE
jgi:metallo-beta-lactamase class B